MMRLVLTMQRILRLSIIVIPLLSMACAAPVAVKQLSVAQIGYFDAAISAVEIQSEALVSAAEQIKKQAEEGIEQDVKDVRKISQDLLALLPSLPVEKRQDTADKALEKVEEASRKAMQSRERLNDDIEAIKAKTQELQDYIAKMKEVQVALDAYLQSEQAGEQVTQGLLKQPSVQNLIGSVSNLTPTLVSGLRDVQGLISGLTGGE